MNRDTHSGNSSGPVRAEACVWTSGQLGEFIGNELDGATAQNVAAHLETCVACRDEYEGLRAVREGLRRLAVTPPITTIAMEDVKGRAFAHLERTLTAPVTSPKARKTIGWRWPTLPVWRPMATMLVAATVGAGAVFLMPLQTLPSGTAPVASSQDGIAQGAKTPTRAELTTLFDLHDAHAVAWAGDEAVLRRDEAAEAHNALLTRADSVAAEGL